MSSPARLQHAHSVFCPRLKFDGSAHCAARDRRCAAASRFYHDYSAILDHPLSRVMTGEEWSRSGSPGLDSPVSCKRAVLNKRRNPVLNFVGGEFVTVIAFNGAMFRQHASRPRSEEHTSE